MKKLTILITLLTFTSLSLAQSVEIKDNDGNILIQINDEGELGGSITLPNAGDASSFPEKLINMFGELYWNGYRLIKEGEVTTKYLSVPACSFVRHTTDDPHIYQNWKIEGFPSGNHDLYAPVFLPHGAEVTEFAATIYNADPSTVVTIELVRNSMSNNSHPNETMASTIGGPYTTWDTHIDETINYAIIDNSDYEYFLHLTWDEPDDEYRIAFHSARIKFDE